MSINSNNSNTIINAATTNNSDIDTNVTTTTTVTDNVADVADKAVINEVYTAIIGGVCGCSDGGGDSDGDVVVGDLAEIDDRTIPNNNFNKEKPTKKLTDEVMRDLFISFCAQTNDIKLTTFINVMKQSSNMKAICSHWNDRRLYQMKQDLMSVASTFKVYNAWCVSEKKKMTNKNKKNASNCEAIPEELKNIYARIDKTVSYLWSRTCKKKF